MGMHVKFIVCFIAIVGANGKDEDSAKMFLDDFERQMSQMCREARLSEWEFSVNINDESQRHMVEQLTKEANLVKHTWTEVKSYDWKNFKNESVKRQFQIMSLIGSSALDKPDFIQFKNISSAMETIYSSTTICDLRKKCGLNLEPEITEIMATSRDYHELLHTWQQWHDQVGQPMRKYYPEYVSWSNIAAKANGLNNMAEIWLKAYETESFDKDVEKIMIALKPFYDQLHAYVRRKLNTIYKDKIRLDGPIPAHLLGNMWAQSWENIEDIVKPFPGKPSADATAAMKGQKYTVTQMFKVAEEFYTSLGLEGLPDVFWAKSVLERPVGVNMTCHASAWDFCDGQDVRIKMCTQVKMEDFVVIHHELGHIQYFQQYKNLPFAFRDGANPGFHEAVGDVMALSVGTPSHLRKIGLLPNWTEDPESEINYLMSKALQKLAFFPFAYVADLWRWKVFRNEITQNEYNSKWWELRTSYQGIEPAVPRSENQFDPGAKYHIAADVEYLRYFVAAIIQFQFHKTLCLAAKQYDPNDVNKPLHKCDIYNSREAGLKLHEMLSLGKSLPWPEVMKSMTGSSLMDASPILEYFKPLHEFLKEENKKNKEYIGWTNGAPVLLNQIPMIVICPVIAIFYTLTQKF